MSVIQEYNKIIELSVRWGDQDLFEHVNHTQYLAYCETARWAYFTVDYLKKMMNEKNIGHVLRHVEADFFKPLFYPQIIQIATKVIKIGHTSIVMQHHIFDEVQTPCFFMQAILVYYDFKNNTKVSVPKCILSMIQNNDFL